MLSYSNLLDLLDCQFKRSIQIEEEERMEEKRAIETRQMIHGNAESSDFKILDILMGTDFIKYYIHAVVAALDLGSLSLL